MEALDEHGGELSAITPGDASSSVKDVMDKDAAKYQALAEQVNSKAEKLKLQRQKSMEVRAGGRKMGKPGAKQEGSWRVWGVGRYIMGREFFQIAREVQMQQNLENKMDIICL